MDKLSGFEAAHFRDICGTLGVCASGFGAAGEQAARNGELLERAMFITGKSAKEVRAMAAASPLSFVDFVGSLTIVPVVPTMPAPAQRWVKRGGYLCCSACGMAQEWCNCASRPAATAPSGDATAELNLEQRARECKGR